MNEHRQKLKRALLEIEEHNTSVSGSLANRGDKAPLWDPTEEELEKIGRDTALARVLAMAMGTCDRVFRC